MESVKKKDICIKSWSLDQIFQKVFLLLSFYKCYFCYFEPIYGHWCVMQNYHSGGPFPILLFVSRSYVEKLTVIY